MKLRELIAGWPQWSGWRRYAPAAGSVVAHAFLGLAVFSMLAATSKPQPSPTIRLPPKLEVTLVAETPPPRGIRPTPPDAPKAPPRSEPKTETAEAPPVAKDPRRDQKQRAAAQPAIAGGAPSNEKGGVYLGDSALADSGVPLGLRSLLEADPCKPRNGLPHGDCGPTWAQKFASNNFQILPTEAQLRRMYPGIIPPCPYKVGCNGPPDGKLNNGARSVFNSFGSPMMAGAGSLGGMSQTVERLGFNPDHTDPGFGD